MTIQVELSPETEARLAAQAAARSMDVPTYAASLLEEAARPTAAKLEGLTSQPKHQRPPDRKSLAQLFAESPFRGLDLDFERDQDFGRSVEL
jgi:hypothetical protein